MRLTVRHKTNYRYDAPVANAMQQIRLTPKTGPGQTVVDWQIDAPGMDRATTYEDAFGNLVHMISAQGTSEEVEITASGTVETVDINGVIGLENGTSAPARVFTRFTPQTKANQAIRRLAAAAEKDDMIAGLHELMHTIRDKVGVTDTHATAISALANGEGVCQDHAHIFIAACRSIDLPARYVSGYLFLDDEQSSEAHHAWAEACVPDLGWVGFDISNGICPTDRYIRLTAGLDSRSAASGSAVLRRTWMSKWTWNRPHASNSSSNRVITGAVCRSCERRR